DQDGDGFGIYGKRYDASGNALTPPPAALRGTESGDEFRISTTTAFGQEDADVAMDANGNFVVVWVDTGDLDGNNNGVFMQLYDASGAPVSVETQVNTTTLGDQGFPSVDMDADGDFVV